MNEQKVADFIKKIRKDNNLTQKDLAEKLSVTYQAVSKWENGKNLPDLVMLQTLCEMYDYDMSEIFGSKKSHKKLVLYISGLVLILTVLVTMIFFINRDNDDFEFKTISSSCEAFKIKGSAAYTDKKSSIYISNIDYCGIENDEIYKSISCTLYENHKDSRKSISTCDEKKKITLEDYLKDLTIKVDNYNSMCKRFLNSELDLEISALSKDGKNIIYKIPLVIDENC